MRGRGGAMPGEGGRRGDTVPGVRMRWESTTRGCVAMEVRDAMMNKERGKMNHKIKSTEQRDEACVLHLRKRTTLGVRATGTSRGLSNVGGTVTARTGRKTLRFTRLAEITTRQVHRRHR